MRFQRLYRVESDFSVSFGPKPKLNNNKKGRLGGGGITYKQKYSLIRGHISTTTPWGVGLTSISNKPEVRGGDGKFLSFRDQFAKNEYIRCSYSVKFSITNIFVFLFGQKFNIRVTLLPSHPLSIFCKF